MQAYINECKLCKFLNWSRNYKSIHGEYIWPSGLDWCKYHICARISAPNPSFFSLCLVETVRPISGEKMIFSAATNNVCEIGVVSIEKFIFFVNIFKILIYINMILTNFIIHVKLHNCRSFANENCAVFSKFSPKITFFDQNLGLYLKFVWKQCLFHSCWLFSTFWD